MAPRSKCSLVGVECVAGEVSPFEVRVYVSVCVYTVCVRFTRVKIAVAVQEGVSF